MSLRAAVALAALVLVALAPHLAARDQSAVDPGLFQDFTWRSLGPFRGGRVTAATGVAALPNVFFVGTADGGVWKTTDAGQSWQPVFDEQSMGSIGAIAVAPSNPDVMYVGTGAPPDDEDVTPGDGVYRSQDGGRSWTRVGLTSSQHIARIVVHPQEANRVFVAVLGSAFGGGPERGVFRSDDGGRSFEQVLGAGADSGASDLSMDPTNPRILYASLWRFRRNAWDLRVSSGSSATVAKSADGGATWRTLSSLPTPSSAFGVRVTLAVSPSDGQRVFALAASAQGAALFTSSNGGDTWAATPAATSLATSEHARVAVAQDATGRPVVYVIGTGVWRSADLGASFSPWVDATNGERFDDVWINPVAPSMAIAASTRGAIVTVNGGASWTRPDSQPFSRFAHIAIDNTYPFRACGADTVSGPGCLLLRGESGRVTRQDWRTVGTGRNTFVAPDPTDPDVVFSGALSRHDRRTGQIQDVAPVLRDAPDRRPSPLMFAPAETRALLFADESVWKSTTSGTTWIAVSPTLSRDLPVDRPVAESRADTLAAGTVRSVVSALGPSPVDAKVLWAGTDGGAIHVTRDAGVTWREVTPHGTAVWSRVSAIEPSHFDSNTAYVALDRRRLGNAAPHLLRTRDGGVTWTLVTTGLPADATVHVVREDQFRRGLLFAGTSRSVFVSFDDGDSWQPFRLNLPPTGIRDLAIRESTLIAATGGRGFWAVDDIAVLRQVTPDITRTSAFLFRPATAWRSSPRVPGDAAEAVSAPNPPEGVALSYLVGTGATASVTLEIIETATGDLVRRYASTGDPATLDARPGLHHVMWDLRYTPVAGRAPMVVPGAYQVRLTIGGQPLRQAVLVRLDPRIRTAAADLTLLLKQSRAINAKRADLIAGLARTTDAARAADLRRVLDRLDRLFDIVQQADVRPTAVVDAAITTALDQATLALAPLP